MKEKKNRKIDWVIIFSILIIAIVIFIGGFGIGYYFYQKDVERQKINQEIEQNKKEIEGLKKEISVLKSQQGVIPEQSLPED